MRMSRARFWLPVLVLALAGVADAATTLQGTIKCAAAQCAASDLSDGNTGTGTIVHANGPQINLPTYTVAGLPAAVVGSIAYVTDQATACPALDGTFTGGGTVKCFATYNGTAWVHN